MTYLRWLCLCLLSSALFPGPPVYEVKQGVLWRDGRELLREGDERWKIFWRLGWPDRYSEGEEFGVFQDCWVYAETGLLICGGEVDVVGISTLSAQRIQVPRCR